MANPDLMTLFYCIATLFFSYQLIKFITEIIIYYKNKTLGNNIISREMIMSTWLLVPFIVAYGYTILIVNNFAKLKVPHYVLDNNYWMIFGFSVGLTFMITIFVIITKVKKDERPINATLSSDDNQQEQQETFTGNKETRKSNSTRQFSYNSFTTYNNIIINIMNNLVFNVRTEENKYYNNTSTSQTHRQVYKKINKPTKSKDEIFDLKNIESLDFEEFKDSNIFRREGNKIVLLKRGGRKKLKDRQYLLYTLDKKFGGHFSKIEKDDLMKIKEVVTFINKHIIFKCEKCPDENEYNAKNFKDWLEKVNK